MTLYIAVIEDQTEDRTPEEVDGLVRELIDDGYGLKVVRVNRGEVVE